MWEKIARFILRSRWMLLILLLALTGLMGYHASKVQMSYEFARAIPTDNPKYQAYQAFRSQFGEDGNLMAIGITTDKLFQADVFNDYAALAKQIKGVNAVEDVLSVPAATNLVKDTTNEKLNGVPVFPGRQLTQPELDSMAKLFYSLPFYQGLLFDPTSNTYMMGIRINKDVLNSKGRNKVVTEIVAIADAFGKKHNLEMHYSGLPLIRTNLATKVASEMQWFLLGSLILSAIILLIFFRSFSATLMSLAVVIIGVIWCMGTIEWMGYKITLLTGVIPPLIVVIGIPNCIYFLNKYHTAYNDINSEVFTNESRKRVALTAMISRMGVVTLFCNIAAAIGFAVFGLTKSAVLKEFGIVAGFNIMALFFISIMFIPAVLSLLPDPKKRHTKYLENKWLLAILDSLERWSSNHKKLIYGVTAIILLASVAGMFRLKSVGFIVDDLPKTDKIYKDLKYFEEHFRGVMPLEIVIDTKQKQGLRRSPVQTFARIDSLSQFITAQPEMARPLSIVEGLKFARQAYYNGDSSAYKAPNEADLLFLSQYLSAKASADSSGKSNNFNRVVASFMDSNRRLARISVSMKDVGSKRLPELISTIEDRSRQLFDTSKYHVEFTGTSITFLEGSAFIINGLKESIMWAFLLIALCMLYLFRSFKILICSLIPNIIPLIITAGVMGWAGVAIKPSTVLVFSVALGIAIDITIRFLVNYKQELSINSKKTSHELVIDTIHKTGISIIYTSLVLIAGFVIFCFSGFGGTQALGWLTSLTLILATLTNLIFLPALLMTMIKK
ncbi:MULTISPECIES: efflux RND transporter permease subunit [Niastella]|uniref:MMPL family transporter n=1 Tax=Niastella soli TaxID=2821487 RepID=A0ABS3YMT5_9BACT|nr:MMPL family transporter [Niastella soli]MBO9199190.1 MMPL family transporter [Niastella soli]